MRVLELFAGIGGLSLGLERAGMTTVALCEIDADCRFWLSRNFPGVPVYEDVRSLTAESLAGLGPIDLIAGGFPCQPHSVAGKQRGREDERHLWPEFARLVREIRPRWVLAENVPGIRTTASDEVLRDLEAAGYSCWALVVGADHVGAPHRRRRVWFVGHANCARLERRERETRDAQLAIVPDWPPRPSKVRGIPFEADGLPSGPARRRASRLRRARLKALGNAVVPQVAEAIGRAILRMDACRS